ncbi:MAG: DUF4364 family protein, partial [Bacillota bacterium]|nr:DUF4364 family protein [Bacillota bacterium]
MPYDAFDAGIEPGGLRNKEEIRILICYMLYSVKEPVEKDIVINALQENGIANYFETLESFNDLAQNGNITVSEGDKTKYIVSKSGEMIALQLESSLPITVKNKAMFSAMTILNKIKIEKENTVKIKKIESGYTVSGSISGGNLDLF